MGWSSWNQFRCNISEDLILQTADAMVSSGMKAAGYEYVNIDDCWSLKTRNASGYLVADPSKFPHGIAWLAEQIHNRGLKLGIYSAAGLLTCQGYPGSYEHEQLDATLFASWGIDYLKHDLCFVKIKQDIRKSYTIMRDALKQTGHPIVYSICEYGLDSVWTWGDSVGHLWRTTEDISDKWTRWTTILDRQRKIFNYSGPGGWNDPDMLIVGLGALPADQYRAHFGLWALLAAPLLAGNDLRAMTPEVRAMLTNKEIIAVDQDPWGVQATRIASRLEAEVWARPLSDGGYAAALFNRDTRPATITLTLANLSTFWVPILREKGLPVRWETFRRAALRDLWEHRDLGVVEERWSVQVPPRATVLIHIEPVN